MESHEPYCPFDDPAVRQTEFAGNDGFAAIYNIAPVLPGHSLVIPRRHVERMGSLDDDEICRLFSFARKVTGFLLGQFKADGFDWTIQDGVSAGQTIEHVHLHIIPRWSGDLPSPGDWYARLNLPISSDTEGVIDSNTRRRLERDEMGRIVSTLRHAATRYSLGIYSVSESAEQSQLA